jgi:hypothetical protein
LTKLFLTPFALGLFFLQFDSRGVNDIRRRLLQQNRTWRIPERRVRKFVKRQTCQGYDTDSVFTEDDAVSVTSVRDRVLGMVKETGRFLGSTQTTYVATGTAPVFEIETTRSLLSQMGVQFDSPDNGNHDVFLSPIRETPSKSTGTDAFSPAADNNNTPSSSFDTPTGRVVLAERFYDAVSEEKKENGSYGDETLDMYKDDNDGRKERRCGVCDGCAVM